MSKRKCITITVALAVVMLLGIGSFVADRIVLGLLHARMDTPETSLLLKDSDIAADHPYEDVSFQYEDYTLRGHVYGADNTRGLIVFRHGIFSQHQDYLALITAMVDKGWRVFAYDAPGCGESDGDSTLGMPQSPLDVEAAVLFAKRSGMANGMPIALWGHSWGGYGVAAALGRIDGVEACVTMSGYDTPMKILLASMESSLGLLAYTQAPTLWLNLHIDFGSDADTCASEAIVASGVPTLVIHGDEDATVSFEGASVFAGLKDNGAVPDNVTFVTKTEPGRNGHADYFYSHESQAYLNACSEELAALLEENGGDASSPEVSEYMQGVDKFSANTADPELIDEIDGFLSSALSR